MSDDNRLQQAVLAELRWDPSVTAAHIGVSAKAGVVTLNGHVESYVEKCAAETAARRVKGVRAVAEEIDVRLPVDILRSDEDIAAAAIERLAWDVSIPRDAVAVTVDQGWLTLTGAVGWHYQHAAAETDVASLSGVVGVTNRITITPKVDTAHLGDDIMHALHRSWFFDPETIRVEADGGKVRLSGTVKSLHEWEIAESTAWAATGATAVVNDISID